MQARGKGVACRCGVGGSVLHVGVVLVVVCCVWGEGGWVRRMKHQFNQKCELHISCWKDCNSSPNLCVQEPLLYLAPLFRGEITDFRLLNSSDC